jgi:hypothetical protein
MVLGATLPAATNSIAPKPDHLVTVDASQISLPSLRIIDNIWSSLNSGAGAAAGYISSSGESVVIDFGKRVAESEKDPKWQIKFGRNQKARVGGDSDPIFWIRNDSGDSIIVNVSEAEELPSGVTLELHANGILISRVVGNSTNPEASKANNVIVPGTYSLPANDSAPVYILVNTDGSVTEGIWEVNLRLGFTIPSRQDGDDTAPIPTTTAVDITGFISTSTLEVDNNGIVQETVQLTSLDGVASIIIPEGTKLLDAQGRPLDLLSATSVTSPPPAPLQAAIACAYSFGPEGATFSPPLTLTLSYDPLELPLGVEETELYIAHWDGSRWLPLDSIVDIIAKTVSAEVGHFSQFAVLYDLSPSPLYSAIQFHQMRIVPGQVEPGEEVTIAVELINIGSIEGSQIVELKIDGKAEETRTIILRSGASTLVTFVVTKDIPGTYQVSLDGLSGEFIVTTPVLLQAPQATMPPLLPEASDAKPLEPPAMPEPDWTPISSTIGAILVVFLLVYLLWRRRRAVSFSSGSRFKSNRVQHRATETRK